jgi:translation elongation factor EF-G
MLIEMFEILKFRNSYNVPRIVFVNKCDRLGANPLRAIRQLKEKLKLPVVAIQVQFFVDLEKDFCLKT